MRMACESDSVCEHSARTCGGQSSNILRWPRARKRLWVAHTPYCEVYPLLQGIPPIETYTPYYKVYALLQGIPYCEVYPLLQGIPPIARYTPYCEVYPLLQGIPPIARYTPYYEVYPLLQGIPPIARYIDAIAHKIYPLHQ